MSLAEPIQTDNAPAPGGHYSQATAFGDLVFVSGQLPVGVGGRHDPAASFEAQTRITMHNLFAILEAVGCQSQDVLRVTAYIVGVENWPAFNQVYADAFGSSRPARVVVPVPELHHGYLVEIEAIAARASR